MENLQYTYETVVVRDGKKVKGKLSLLMDRYEFDGTENKVNWEKIKYQRETVIVKTFIFSKEKPCISINEGNNTSEKFVFSEDCIVEVEAVIKKLALAVKEKREEEERIKKLENDYLNANDLMRHSNSERLFLDASKAFEKLGEYKDSKELAKKCKSEAEKSRLESEYNYATGLKKKAKTPYELKEVQKAFNKIKEYRDSQQQADWCLKEAERLVNEKSYEEADRLSKTAKDKKSIREVCKAFEKLGNFKDSAQRAEFYKSEYNRLVKEEAEKERIRQLEEVYSSALEMKNSAKTPEDFIEAGKMFSTIKYKDSTEQASYCERISKILIKEEKERKEKARLNRIQEEVDESLNDKTIEKLEILSNSAARQAATLFVENPYRVLGVSTSASNNDLNDALEKIKKLFRLNAVDSYKTPFDLHGVEKPIRDTSSVQNALTLTKELRYKWFWFSEKQGCAAWKNERYQEELEKEGFEHGTYDIFLANYMAAVFYDYKFEKKIQWVRFFKFYSYICKNRMYDLLRSQLNEKELNYYTSGQIFNSFRSEIFNPLYELCGTDDDAINIVRLYTILAEINEDVLDGLRKNVSGRLANWFALREKEAKGFNDSYRKLETITDDVSKIIRERGETYVKEVKCALDFALDNLDKNYVRQEMIKESFKTTIFDFMIILNKSENKDNAIFFANIVYNYCKDDDKRSIRNTFGINSIKGCDKDVTNADWDFMGDCYMEGKNGYDKDYVKAAEWYTKAANAGNKYSQNSIGICYMEGKGVIKNSYTAATWFEKAYNNGNPDGAYNLAECYFSGNGRIKNSEKAIDMWIEAAKLGHPNAANRAQAAIELIQTERKLHRLTQHHHYDMGYQFIGYGETKIVEVTLNYSANVYLMDNGDYKNYCELERFSYYGGRATQSPYRIKIPSSGFWHLVVDNGDDDLGSIRSSASVRTINF